MAGKITREEAEEVFKAFDKDGNGSISKSELKDILGQLFAKCDGAEIEEISAGIMAECDGKGDGDGKISRDEFFAVLPLE